MNIAHSQPWTAERFFAWARTQDARYEFNGTAPVLMTGGSNNAALIGVNLIVALRTRLRGTAWRPLGPDAGLETTNGAIRYPDALITGSPIDGAAHTVPNPIVVVEVVGGTPDASRRDRLLKVREYAAVATIRRYIILESTSAGATVLARETAAEPWRTAVLTAGDTLNLPEIGIEIPMLEFYADVSFPAEPAGP